MTKSVKRLIVAIGCLSLISGVYSAYIGSDFSEYFTGIFIGVTLIGTALLSKEQISEE